MRLLSPDEVREGLGFSRAPVPTREDVDDWIAAALILAGCAVGHLLRWVLP